MTFFTICYCAGGISISLLASNFWPYAVEFYENVSDVDEVFNTVASYIMSSNIRYVAAVVAVSLSNYQVGFKFGNHRTLRSFLIYRKVL